MAEGSETMAKEKHDALNTQWLFESDNEWGIPTVPPVPLSAVPKDVVRYRTHTQNLYLRTHAAVHFFLEDYRFESVWNQPATALRSLAGWKVIFSPDFSLYRTDPLSLQMLNVYRNRWCQAYWSYHGHTVIPVVSWGTAASYPFAFLGIPRRSVVAVGTVGIEWTRAADAHYFAAGWEMMLERLQPSKVLSYGPIPEALKQDVEVHCYPSEWEKIEAQKGQANGR